MKITLLCLLLSGWLSVASANNEPAAARVNGEVISEFRLERYFAEYLEDQGRAVASIRNPKAYKQLRQAALDALIDKELLWQESRKRGILIDDQTVNQQVEQTRQAIGGTENFLRRLQDAGFDEASFTEYTRRELAAQQTFAELTRTPEPEEKQVREFFQQHRAEMGTPEQVQARHILIKVAADADPATVEAARLRLMQMHVAVSQGESFASVAQTGSEDATASQGGELGYFSRGQMVPAFEAAAFALKPGELSGAVRSPFGWHLIIVENHLEAADVPELQGLETVRAYLARQQQSQARRQVLAQLRAQNRIERIDDE
ncbi:peptidylprolyl isomerase [Pseudomonas sp. B2M1-30]|uniref:peptidylprolyl isomerase n=1 Tax=Pseudomonas koreensis TaxID=198620 RepID=A0A9X2XL09_9PSED|nr:MULTISPECIES: peptidylprolyl isomerase [Pseudomonas]MCU0122226.1 peptidylprolyl isomerase [Pseudomonas sp. B2M1-30]MCU7250837.1 peptidylprolyl isomerase [Pseudomonas koreensis]MCU7264520.1 peptidylprolyl isomerase [Pseudomonas koreensis]